MLEKVSKWVIKGSNGFAADQSAKTFTKDRKLAYEWKTKEAAENVLLNCCKFNICKDAEVEEVHVYYSSVADEVVEHVAILNQFVSLVEQYKEMKKDLTKRLSELELQQNDILHYIQLSNISTVSGFKIYKKLQKVRQERSKVKQLIHLVDTVQQMNIDTEKLNETISSLQKDLYYRPRVIDFDDMLKEE